MVHEPEAPRGGEEWTGPRPLVSGTPVVVGAVIVGLVLLLMLASVTKRPGLAATLSQDYTAMAAGELAAEVQTREAGELSATLVGQGLPFAPRIVPLDPDFQLLGGRRHDQEGRRGAAWFYRAPSAELALAEAFEGRLDELGPPDEVRADAAPELRLYRKTTQTLVCWQDGPLVYVFISTLPSEPVVRLARRQAAPAAPTGPR